MKDVIVSIDTSKDSDCDSSKPSSKTTSLQNSPAVQKGQSAHFLQLTQEAAVDETQTWQMGNTTKQIITPLVL